MSKTPIASLPDFDIAEQLKDQNDIAEYLNIVLEENDPAALAEALGTIARANPYKQSKKPSY